MGIRDQIAAQKAESAPDRGYAAKISAAWQSSIEGILETGRLLVEAKAKLPHGAFAAMIEGNLPFKPRTAQKLMAIASDQRITNATHESHLPPSWTTLYELTKLPDDVFEAKVADGSIHPEMERKDITAVVKSERRENDFYPTPSALVAEVARRWKPRSKIVWEPCAGDGRVADALREAGFDVVTGDIAHGVDFFTLTQAPATALCTNPPFDRVREFIDHAFAIGVREMCLVLPERLWACGEGRAQFERHRPAVWANMDWREDYLGKGGSPDRALAVAIWTGPCAESCDFDVWTRQAEASAETYDPETGEITEPGWDYDSLAQTPDTEPAVPDPDAADPGTDAPKPSVAGAGEGGAHNPTSSPVEIPAAKASEAEPVADEPPPQRTEVQRIMDAVLANKKGTPRRPHCLRPQMCAGHGPNHCFECMKAHADANGEAA